MKIVVLAGGLSTERDVSFKTGDMVAKVLRENGHQVILLDVFMGYSDKKEDLTGIFDRSEEVSVKVSGIPEIAPDLAKVKACRKDQQLTGSGLSASDGFCSAKCCRSDRKQRKQDWRCRKKKEDIRLLFWKSDHLCKDHGQSLLP